MKQSVLAAITAAALLTGVGIATMPTASEAAVKSSAALRDACGADARKFCKSVVSNTAKRTACMKSHYAELSAKCKDAIQAAKK